MTDNTIVLHDHDKSPTDLVALAIAKLEEEVAHIDIMIAEQEAKGYPHLELTWQRAIRTTHLAEFREHKKILLADGEKCKCGHWWLENGHCLTVITKAKRLLGREYK